MLDAAEMQISGDIYQSLRGNHEHVYTKRDVTLYDRVP
jgi:hypothetical protein